MCSLSGSWDLAKQYPTLRRIILEGATEPLPAGLDLAFALYLGPHARMAGPQLDVDVEAKTWAWLMELAYPPFAFLLQIKNSAADPVIVAELLGHARLETTRGYTRPTAEDRTRALDLLPTDR